MPRRILVVKLSSIGDVIHALPAARALRLGFPEAYICWAVHRSCKDVVEGNRYLDEVYVVQDKSLSGIMRAGRDLARRNFDLAIDMQGLFRTGLLSWLSGAPERIGFSGHQELHSMFVNRPEVKPGYVRPAPYCQMEFAVAAGAPRIEPVAEIFLSPDIRQAVRDRLAPALARGGPIVAIHPGAAWETKRWTPEKFARVADGLVRRLGAEIVVTGGPTDSEMTAQTAAAMRFSPIDLGGKTSLKELAAVFEESSVYVGGDTGSMHIAAAVGTPVVAIFGPTDPDKTGPVGTESRIIRHEVPCGPCRRRSCDHHTCMTLVDVSEVVEAAAELIKSTVPRRTVSPSQEPSEKSPRAMPAEIPRTPTG